MPFKVLQVITKGEHGGAQTHVRTLCRTLAHQVHFSVAIGGTGVSPLEEDLRERGLTVSHIQHMRNSMAPWHVALAVIELIKVIRKQNPQIVHAHSAVAGIVARIAGRLSNTPVVYTVHGFAFKPEIRWPRRVLAWWCEWMLAGWTRAMICVSDHERMLAYRLPIRSDRLHRVLNAIEDNCHSPEQVVGPVGITMVARLAPPKRPDLLLSALARLRDSMGYEVPTRLVGDGPDRDMLIQMASGLGLKQIEFMGDVHNVSGLLAKQCVFVLLSDHEGLPISVIEAMRASLPIVASDLPGLRELLDPGQSGILVSNQVDAIAAALEKLIRSPALRESMGHAARLRYLKYHTPEYMASAMLKIYNQAVE